MRLTEIYDLFDDYIDIQVINSDGDIIAQSDDMNTIPDTLNHCEVYRIYPVDDHTIEVELYDVDSEDYTLSEALNTTHVLSTMNNLKGN